MIVPLPGERALVAAAVAGAAAVGASTASAATIAPGTPAPATSRRLRVEQWVPISGSGFTPNTDPAVNTVELKYSNGDLGAFTPLAADGSFNVGAFMPTEFIRSSAGRTKTYTLTATDRQTPGLVASTNVTFVRVGANVKPSRVGNNLDRRVRWSVWGPPTGAKMYLHWTFKGRRYAVRKLGTAKGACGIAHKKLPFLPVCAAHRHVEGLLHRRQEVQPQAGAVPDRPERVQDASGAAPRPSARRA